MTADLKSLREELVATKERSLSMEHPWDAEWVEVDRRVSVAETETTDMKEYLAVIESAVDRIADETVVSPTALGFDRNFSQLQKRTVTEEIAEETEHMRPLRKQSASEGGDVQNKKQQLIDRIEAFGIERNSVVSQIVRLNEEADLVQRRHLSAKEDMSARATTAEQLSSLAKAEAIEPMRRLEASEGARAADQAAAEARASAFEIEIPELHKRLEMVRVAREAERAETQEHVSASQGVVARVEEKMATMRAAGAAETEETKVPLATLEGGGGAVLCKEREWSGKVGNVPVNNQVTGDEPMSARQIELFDLRNRLVNAEGEIVSERAQHVARLTELKKEIYVLNERQRVDEDARATERMDERQRASVLLKDYNDLQERATEEENSLGAERAHTFGCTSALEAEVAQLKEQVAAVMDAGARGRAKTSAVLQGLSQQEMQCRERLVVAERELAMERNHAVRSTSVQQLLQERILAANKTESELREKWTEEVSALRHELSEVAEAMATTEGVYANAVRRESNSRLQVTELEAHLEEREKNFAVERAEAKTRTEILEKQVAKATGLLVAEEHARGEERSAAAREVTTLGKEVDDLKVRVTDQERTQSMEREAMAAETVRLEDKISRTNAHLVQAEDSRDAERDESFRQASACQLKVTTVTGRLAEQERAQAAERKAVVARTAGLEEEARRKSDLLVEAKRIHTAERGEWIRQVSVCKRASADLTARLAEQKSADAVMRAGAVEKAKVWQTEASAVARRVTDERRARVDEWSAAMRETSVLRAAVNSLRDCHLLEEQRTTEPNGRETAPEHSSIPTRDSLSSTRRENVCTIGERLLGLSSARVASPAAQDEEVVRHDRFRLRKDGIRAPHRMPDEPAMTHAMHVTYLQADSTSVESMERPQSGTSVPERNRYQHSPDRSRQKSRPETLVAGACRRDQPGSVVERMVTRRSVYAPGIADGTTEEEEERDIDEVPLRASRTIASRIATDILRGEEELERRRRYEERRAKTATLSRHRQMGATTGANLYTTPRTCRQDSTVEGTSSSL